MAKRLTDTEKWKRMNFRELPTAMKLAFFYLLDNCDNCGIWHPDFGLMSFQIGEMITEAEFMKHFGHKVLRLRNGAYFIPSFVEFQYGVLDPEVRPHRPVIAALKRYGIELSNPLLTLTEGDVSCSVTDKDQDKEKEKDQEKEKKSAPADEPPRERTTQSIPGPVPEIADVMGALILLGESSHAGQQAIIRAYGLDEVRKHIPLCLAKYELVKHLPETSPGPVYFRSWLENERVKLERSPPEKREPPTTKVLATAVVPNIDETRQMIDAMKERSNARPEVARAAVRAVLSGKKELEVGT